MTINRHTLTVVLLKMLMKQNTICFHKKKKIKYMYNRIKLRLVFSMSKCQRSIKHVYSFEGKGSWKKVIDLAVLPFLCETQKVSNVGDIYPS